MPEVQSAGDDIVDRKRGMSPICSGAWRINARPSRSCAHRIHRVEPTELAEDSTAAALARTARGI